MVKVKFLTSVSTVDGSYGSGEVRHIPESHAKPWLNQGLCELTDEKVNVTERTKAPASEVPAAKPDAPAPVPPAAKVPAKPAVKPPVKKK